MLILSSFIFYICVIQKINSFSLCLNQDCRRYDLILSNDTYLQDLRSLCTNENSKIDICLFVQYADDTTKVYKSLINADILIQTESQNNVKYKDIAESEQYSKIFQEYMLQSM